MTHRTPAQVARIALACLDLTSLNDTDTEVQIATLCERATGPCGNDGASVFTPGDRPDHVTKHATAVQGQPRKEVENAD